jgi:ATP-dependent DNA helicase PIF1
MEVEIQLSASQTKALDDIVVKRKSGFLTGAAGTGKSFLIKEICDMFQSKSVKYAITASTGLAAVLINGVTIYNFFWISPLDLDKDATVNLKRVNKYKSLKAKIKQVQVLIIEEVSMLGISVFQRVHDILCYVHNSSAPFGGIQVLLVGDFFQLPAVVKGTEEKQFLFDCPLFWETCDEMWELKEVFRQTDPSFCELLHRIRNGSYTEEDVQVLQKRVGMKVGNDDVQPTNLLSKKYNVQSLNSSRIKELGTETKYFESKSGFITKKDHASKSDDAWTNAIADLKKDIDLPSVMELKIGAQVMLASNFDVAEGLCNGSKGVVVEFKEYPFATFTEASFHKRLSEKDLQKGISKAGYLQGCQLPLVQMTNGNKYLIPYIRWTREKDDLGGEVYCWQIPLRLAWNATIHRSQGQSLDLVQVDLGSDVFEVGQAYVALSRARTLEGLSLTTFDVNSIKTNQKVKDFYLKPFDLQKAEMFMPKLKKVKKEKKEESEKQKILPKKEKSSGFMIIKDEED